MPRKAATKKTAAKKAAKKTVKTEPRAVPRDAIASITGESSFVEFLRRELEWPIPYEVQRLEDVAIPHDLQADFGFKPEENRIRVSRLLNLTEEQPWGVFLFEFKTKRPYLSHLRKLLRVLGSRRTLQKGDPIWDRNDLLFICTQDWRSFEFVHFSGEKPESAVISSFGWKGPEDGFLHTLCHHNLPRLRMPEPEANDTYDVEKWRTAWREAFNIKPVTDAFYATLKEVFNAIQSGVQGLQGEDLRFFSVLLLNRLVFLKFVEKKGWLNGNKDYLWNKFQEYGQKRYWKDFLFHFFFEGLNTETASRSSTTNDLLGEVPFLNAELFALSSRWDDTQVDVENRVFDLLFDKLLNPFNFTVCETSPLEVEVAFNQDLLGYGYEELIADQHGQGAYYTQPAEVNLMCRESLRAFLESRCEAVDKDLIGRLVYGELTEADTLAEADALALYIALHDVTVVDPALGSGTFPVAMMKHLLQNLRTLGEALRESSEFKQRINAGELTDPADAFALKLHIIERSLYGCDIDYFAVQIAKLRFWIELMVDCEQPIPLPNLKCKLVVGDALVSALGTDRNGKVITLEELLGHPTKGQMPLQKEMVDKLAQTKIDYYRETDAKRLRELEQEIENQREALLGQLGIDLASMKRTDKHVLWQIDFAEIFTGKNPGFDIAIANPPYLRQEKINESFQERDLLTDKTKMISVYENMDSSKIAQKSDLYLYFFYRSLQLLRLHNGSLNFIVSNSWLDTDFGDPFKDHITRRTSLSLVIDSNIRSFDNADVNTVIVSIINQPPRNHHIGRFVRFTERPGTSGLNLQEKDEGVDVSRDIKLTLLNEKMHSPGGVHYKKWGGRFLRSPDFYDVVFEKKSAWFTRLGSVAKIRFGCHTGLNDFFYIPKNVAEEWALEEQYLVPLVRSTRGVKGPQICVDKIEERLLVCGETLAYLKDNAPGVHSYIKWGERQTTRQRQQRAEGLPWPEVTSLRGRTPGWWSLPSAAGVRSRLLMQYVVGTYFKCPLADFPVISDACFHRVIPHKDGIDELLCAILNSSFTLLNVLLFGRSNLGQGALKFERSDAESLVIINPSALGVDAQSSLKSIVLNANKFTYKPLGNIESNSFSAKIDTIIAKELDISDQFLSEIQDYVSLLIQQRLRKATLR